MGLIKKILYILSYQEKKKLFFLFFLILGTAIFNIIGAASILPFISLLANPKLIETSKYFSILYEFLGTLGVSSINQFFFILGIIVFILLITSLFFQAMSQYFNLRFTLMVEASISKILLEGYLHQPYSWFLNRHSANLIKNILSDSAQVINETISPILNIIVYGTITIALISFLIWLNPRIALSVGAVLGISYVVFFWLMKNILTKAGSARFNANSKRYVLLSEIFGAIKEIKIQGLEKFHFNQFSLTAKVFATSQALAKSIGQLPRHFFEAIAFGGLIVLILVLIRDGDNFTQTIPMLTLYAFVGYRLMPAFQQLYICFTQLRFSGVALDNLHKDLVSLGSFEFKTNEPPNMPLSRSIILKNIYFNYPNTEKFALKDINIVIPAFSKVGIVGTTGSGKTTLVDIMLGLLNPSQGTLNVDGETITNINRRSWQKNIGYVPQQIYLSDCSISKNIAFGVDDKNINQNLVEKVSVIANLHDFVINELPEGYNTIIGERGVRLSGGQCQRIGIARALYHNPQILVLDEATSSLDNITENSVMTSIENLEDKKTIVIIAHRLSTVKNCEIIFLIENGVVQAQGTYEEFKKSSSLFKEIFHKTKN